MHPPASTVPPVPRVAAAASAILAQCARFLEHIPPDLYARESRTLKGGTIGKHIRHTVDHFAAAVACVDSGEPIDYDHRARAVPMETAPGVALDAINGLRRRLESLDQDALEGSVRIRVMLSGDGEEATLGSSLGRELHFAFHHAVHHHAMVKAIAAEHGIDTPPEFGVAPSTINFERAR